MEWIRFVILADEGCVEPSELHKVLQTYGARLDQDDRGDFVQPKPGRYLVLVLPEDRLKIEVLVENLGYLIN